MDRANIMTAYQLKNVPERFKSFQIDNRQLAAMLGDKSLSRFLFMIPVTNESLKVYWKALDVELSPLSETATEVPDVSLWSSIGLLLNERAYSALSSALTGHGEFLPITAGGDQMYLFNCQTFGLEDTAVCEKEYIDGFENGLLSLEFDHDDISAKMIFRSELEGCGRLYASERFKQLCEANALEGLRFDTELLSPF